MGCYAERTSRRRTSEVVMEQETGAEVKLKIWQRRLDGEHVGACRINARRRVVESGEVQRGR